MRFRTKMMLVFTSFFVLMTAVFLITLLGYIQGQFIDDVKFRRVSFVRYIRDSLLDLMLTEDALKLEEEIKLIAADMRQIEYIFVVGKDGKLLAHSFSGGFPAELFEANLLAEGQEDKSLLIDSNDRLVRDFAFWAVNHIASEIHVGMDETFVYKTISDTVKTDLLLMLAVLIGGLAAVYVFTSYFSKPFKDLILGMERVGRGDLDFHLEEKGSYEIVHLIRGFNRMAAAILEASTGQKKAEDTLQESEDRYHTMMKSIKDPVYICSPDFRVEYANPAMIERTGRNGRGELCHQFLHNLQKKCTLCIHDRVQKGEYCESDIVSPRDKRSYHLSCTPLVHRDDSISMLTIFRDTSDLLEMENRLRQAQKMEAIGTLAGGIAHDFNNILQPIIGYTEMVIANLPSEKAGREYLDEILAGTLRAKELVKQILSFSRQHQENRKPVKTQAIVKEALKLVRASLPTTIEIQQFIDADCGSILADPVQIHQIIMNLCTNAYQAMEDTGGTLEVKLAKVELAGERVSAADIGPGAYVCLEVSDSGQGIDRDVIARIFEPYFTTKEKGKGTGLGLAVVHGIVKNHDGDILVRSEPGRGTTFTVNFPLLKNRADPALTAAAEPPTGTGERILLVDDERAIAVLGQRMLERLGYQVTISTSSPEALETFRAQPEQFDLVITDLTMPGMTGDQLSKKLLEIRPDIPIIMSTGFGAEITREKAACLGIKIFLPKPVTRKDLARSVRQALDERNRTNP